MTETPDSLRVEVGWCFNTFVIEERFTKFKFVNAASINK